MRKIPQDADAIGSDSFLNAVTITAGVLLVLVMVVGVRATHMPNIFATEEEEAKRLVDEIAIEADSLERDVLRLEQQVQAVTLSAQAKYQERGTLAYILAEHEHELDEAKKTLDAENRSSFEIRRALAAAESDLKKLGDAKAEAEKPKKRTQIKIQSYPTPISHTVYGAEVHFQLSHGRLAWVPLDEMAHLCQLDARSKIDLLQNVSEITEMVGPRHGFEGRYVLLRLDDAAEGGRTPISFSLDLIPVSNELGEPVDKALQEASWFRTKLAEYQPKQTTVTLWTYGDSFKDYARVKEVLYNSGYNVAARPLPDGVYIGGSDHGSRSAAQ
jgi:hypothetical protein